MDIRAVCEDPHLDGEYYIGEFVISNDLIYLVTRDGSAAEFAVTRQLLAIRER
jgi:hypothetical protein